MTSLSVCASRYTGKEKDTESGLDYFGARYYGSNMGRWMSPDPSNWGVDFYYPQTWKHYSYVGNNPLSNTDPNGLWLTHQTHASYQDTSVFVGMYENSSVNPFGHIAIGITGQTPVGLNPTSDLNFLIYATYGGKGGGVSGVAKPQGPKGLKMFVRVPVSGMQAKMIQDQLNRVIGRCRTRRTTTYSAEEGQRATARALLSKCLVTLE